jgi:D-arabinose 1-dehydrogenase-like Zn-dependent alcohol dehydrogenase
MIYADPLRLCCCLDGEALLKEKGQHGDFNPDGGGTNVILATSNSYKATADAIKGIRPDGRVILMGFSTTRVSNSSSRDLAQAHLYHRFHTK